MGVANHFANTPNREILGVMRTLVPIYLVVAACYSPSPQPGAPCGDGRTCPDGLSCSAANTCERGPLDIDAPQVPDAAIDTEMIEPDVPIDAQFCFGTDLVTGCVAPPTTSFSIPSNTTVTLDTDNPQDCPLVVNGFCLLVGTQVNIAGGLRAQGSRPLVVVSASSMSIGGSIDVATRRATTAAGAGANAASCVAGTAAVVHTGGAGGSFSGKGGNGDVGVPAESGGVASAAVTAIATLRGGCAGDNGAGAAPGTGGSGGGAVYVIATSSMTIGGSINASGAGGGGCTANCGGGGGGSGGMIGLDAPTISVTGVVFANGGGGGEGSQSSPAKPGNESVDGAVAPGGTAGSCGGDGGPGSATTAAGDGVAPPATCTPAGGGGGGGGAGLIKVKGTLTNNGTVSPAPS